MNKKSIYILAFIIILCLFPQQGILSMSDNEFVILKKAFDQSGAEISSTLIQVIFDAPQSEEKLNRVLKFNNLNAETIINKNYDNQAISIEYDVSKVSDKSYFHKVLKNRLNTQNIKYQLITIIKGQFQNELTIEDTNNIAYKVLSEINGKKVEGGWIDQQLLSISGYTPSISNKIIAGGNSININIAVGYNDVTGKNEIAVGTPIVNGDY